MTFFLIFLLFSPIYTQNLFPAASGELYRLEIDVLTPAVTSYSIGDTPELWCFIINVGTNPLGYYEINAEFTVISPSGENIPAGWDINGNTIPINGGHLFVNSDPWTIPSDAESGPYDIHVIIYSYNYGIYETETVYNAFSVAPPAPAHELALDSIYDASLYPGGDVDYYQFYVTPGDYSFETFGFIDTYIYLYDTDGLTVITSDDDSGEGLNALINWQCTTPGIYYLQVKGFNEYVTGEYSIAWRARGDFSIDYVSAYFVDYGDTLTVIGSGVTAGTQVNIYWDYASGTNAHLLNTTEANPDGTFECEIDVPSDVVGDHYLWAKDTATGECVYYGPITMVPKIILSQNWGIPGEEITISGYGFSYDEDVILTLWVFQIGTYATDNLGWFSGTFTVPALAYEVYDLMAEDYYGWIYYTDFRVGSGPPTLHQIFYGDVLIGGFPAPDGLVVRAFIGDVWHSWTTTLNGEYNVHVQGDDPSTSVDEGGVDGDLIIFYLWYGDDNYVYAESYYFDSGAETYLDLVCEAGPAPDITVTTDQESYYPGELVTITGVTDANAWVAISVMNPFATPIYTAAVQADALGDYSKAFGLPVDAMTGTYTVDVSITGTTGSTTFIVEQPPHEITVSTDKPEYAPGEIVTMSGEADANAWVAIAVMNPFATPIYTAAVQADALGDYSKAFGLPVDAMTGTYTVDVTAPGTTDSTTFIVVLPGLPAETSNQESLDATGSPKTNFVMGETVMASATVTNAGTQSQSMLIIFQWTDPQLRALPTDYTITVLEPGQSITSAQSALLPPTGYATGTWTCEVVVFTTWPTQGGIVIGEPVTIEITVSASAPYNFVGSIISDVYHIPTCYYVDSIHEHNKIYFSSTQEAEQAGYRACLVCNP